MISSVQPNQASNELYDNLPSEVRCELEEYQKLRVFPAGTQLLAGDAPAEHVIILNQGTVEISVLTANGPISLAVKGAGSVFGLRSIFSESCPEINVICMETCVVSLLPRQEFLKIVNQHPEIYLAAARILSADLNMAIDVLRQSVRSGRA